MVLQSTSSTLRPRNRPANWYSDRVSGTGVTAARIVPGSAPITPAAGRGPVPAPRGQRLAPLGAPALMMLGAAAVLQPAHQGGVAAGHLHAVDAEIEGVFAALARSLGHHQGPSNQGGGL